MATKKSSGTAHPPLDPKVADKLLDLLGTDNEFRRLFKKDAVAALAQVGYPAAQELVDRTRPPRPPNAPPPFACMRVEHIAPKAEIAAARDELRDYLTAAGNHTIVHCFEAGKVQTALRRK
jgi:putative modified peptide